MKHWIGFTFLITLVSILTMGSSCRHLASPTFPPTNTFTPTNTVPAPPTSTATKTATATITSTPTNTATGTSTNTPGGPTNTPTNTPTLTSTFTITSTPTNTATPTITNTPGAGCGTPVLQATYTFATCNQGWTANGIIPTTVTQTNSVGGVTPPGGGAIEIVLPFSGTTTGQELIGMQFASGVTITPGSTISLLYQVVSSTTLSGQYTQIFTQGSVDGGSYFDYSALVTETAPSSSWVTVSYNYPAATGEGVTQFIFQVPANGAPYITSPVTVYIASVSITAPAPSTPTFTPTPIQTWDFESGTAQGWSIVGGSETGTVLSTPTPDAGDSSLYALNLYAPFTSSGYVAPTNNGTSESAGIVQAFTPALNLTGGGIRCQMWIDAGTVAGGYPGGQIFPSDGANTSYSYYVNLTQGAWTELDLSATSTAWGSVNAAAVSQIIIQGATGGWGTGQTFNPSNIQIDNIQVY